MDDFVKVIKRDPKVQIKIKDMFNRLPCNYQSKKGYDTVTQSGIFKKLINILGGVITDMDI